MRARMTQIQENIREAFGLAKSNNTIPCSIRIHHKLSIYTALHGTRRIDYYK